MANRPKGIYKTEFERCRKAAGITNRDEAAARTYLSSERIANIESERTPATPADALAMARGYEAPGLTNYYCTKICPIGNDWVPEVVSDDVSKVTLKILAALGKIDDQKKRLIEITEDGEISEDEMTDLQAIQETLKKISAESAALEIWVQKQIDEGKVKK